MNLQKMLIVEAAAKIIQSDIKAVESGELSEYPNGSQITVIAALDFFA
jgi:hypothetical protein